MIKLEDDGGNGSCPEPGNIAETEDEAEIETEEESEPTNGGAEPR